MIPWRDGAWDRCKLGGEMLPGLSRVTVDAGRDVTLAPSPGKDAPALKDGGGRGATVKIEIKVWTTRRDFSQLTEVARILQRLDPRRPGAVKEPVPIVHPATSIAKVDHVAGGSFTIPPPADGWLIVTVNTVQWFPEEDTTKPARTGPPTPGGGESPGIGDGGPFGDGSVPEPDPANLGAFYP